MRAIPAHQFSFSAAARRQKGISVIDFAIWVGVAGIAIAAIVSLAPGIMNSIRINSESTNLPQIVSCIQKYKWGKPNFAGTTAAQIIQNSCIPNSMVSGTAIVNRWQGSVTVTPRTTATANDSIGLTYTNLPKVACTGLIPVVADTFLSTTVNGTTVKSPGAELDDTAVGTNCDNATNSVEFIFGK